MDTCDVLARLSTLQDMILAHLHIACLLARSEGAAARAQLARRRWEMVRLLREYQLFKHVEILDPAIRCGDPRRAAAAGMLKARCIAAGDDVNRHVARWSGGAIDAGWTEYEVALNEVATALCLHIARERQDIASLLDGTRQTRWPVEPRARKRVP